MRKGQSPEKHGMCGSPEYKAYTQAKYRCENPNEVGYEHYGGRGIKFMFTNFAEFYKAIGPRPKGLTLDRIETNGHYEAGNVRWASWTQQVLNRRIKVGKTGYPGVRRDGRKFSAQITIKYKNHYLGMFDTAEEATLAYQRAKRELR